MRAEDVAGGLLDAYEEVCKSGPEAFEEEQTGRSRVDREADNIVEIRNHGLFENDDLQPEMIALQSARARNGDYFLLIETNFYDSRVPQPCNVFYIVDRKSLTLLC